MTPLPADHPPVRFGKIGVLLVNLGTPDGTDYWSMRRYLKQFLSDRRVIEVPPLIWQIILNTVILTFRPRRSGEAYKAIWNQELNESPLRTFTRAQAEGIAQRLSGDERIVTDWAMRYGNPSIADRMSALQEQGCDRILVFALYPQYSASTTASVYDESFRTAMGFRWQPALRCVPAYHDDAGYIEALAASVRRHIDQQGWQPEAILASFHGLPQEYFDKGDPYHCQCQKTGRLLREALGMDQERLQVTFQSRFGPRQWLQPYTDATLEALAEKGVKKVMVITPGFVADCVETLEEIALEARDTFMEAGGEKYSVVPCLNEDPDHLDALTSIIKRELGGWL